ncbi:hypothetical protein L9F63_004137 [Diploptera punctata]|uniref:tRNA (guanine(26)-N(2))-dimethyltransferase n=1 Tax=Diploptera punctata TaxID=6984 RepID=A0AAD7ZGG7_DIPPU|nr:hypothetical protein L9F63_004137 [Diploptera punctata]
MLPAVPFIHRFVFSRAIFRRHSKLHVKVIFRSTFGRQVMDSESEKVVQEGKAQILLLSDKNVFYNPVQEFNRDLSIAVLTLCSEDHRAQTNSEDDQFTILEALSASGLRSIRYAKEIPGVKKIVANDISEKAVASIQENVSRNGVEQLVSTSHDDAVMVMYRHRRPTERFHAVDLDPYGCPSQFLDAAVQCVSDGGILLVTCTDMAVLAGNCPETCYTKYGAISLRVKCCHELALRIVLQCLESHANRYGRYIVPLLSISADFYVRVFVKIYTSPAIKLALVYQCVGCETLTLQPLGQEHKYGEKPNQFKFTLPHAPPVASTCVHCGHRHHIGGPIWNGPIHDVEFVSRLENVASCGEFGTKKRMQGVLAVVREELMDVPLYYTLDRLCSVLHCETMSMMQFRSALMNCGYRVSLSHANKNIHQDRCTCQRGVGHHEALGKTTPCEAGQAPGGGSSYTVPGARNNCQHGAETRCKSRVS